MPPRSPSEPPSEQPPAPPPEDPPAPAAQLHAALLERGQTVAVAESLTAGLFCATLADVPGASATLRGGAVVYATDLKTALAGVPAELLAANGPVSPQTAAALAAGIRVMCSADWGVGLTGVAGPDPVDGHDPGRVYVGVAGPGQVLVWQLDLTGDRAEVRRQSVVRAMQALLESLGGGPSTGNAAP
ncbi:nicotinamide-nucleotide amidohydrolase family protein [Modestobacter sp. I12A-02628]|uniref:CinA family protein n=1 Tax=Goekera deserti TaxID=2497753 RepID=A0A7K3WIL6_9ACTN|nr:nicotinamide-nucleotide amidohydrolase family protein [Goekera deserti]NDI50514.1 nicotinamide-nucleotide amidohydrolase family protein [Goekera deserti]NEL56172.1 CinA family protein [Goekera deserti]